MCRTKNKTDSHIYRELDHILQHRETVLLQAEIDYPSQSQEEMLLMQLHKNPSLQQHRKYTHEKSFIRFLFVSRSEKDLRRNE